MNLFMTNIGGINPLIPEGHITLGEEGRGRKHVIVPVLPGDGEYFRAGTTPQGVVIGHSQENPGYFLVVADTDGGYSRGANYRVRPVDGFPLPESLAEGLGAWGDAGGIGAFQVALLRVRPGEGFRLREKYGDERIFIADAEGIRSYSKKEWDAARALRAAEEGGVQWL